jgi:hypothetical protein
VPEVFCEKGDEDEEITVLSDPPRFKLREYHVMDLM